MDLRAQIGDPRIAAPGDRGDRGPAARRSRVPRRRRSGAARGAGRQRRGGDDARGADRADAVGHDDHRRRRRADRLPLRPGPPGRGVRPDLDGHEGGDRRDRGPPLLRGVGARRPRRAAGAGEQQLRRRDPGRLDAHRAVRQELRRVRRGADAGGAAAGDGAGPRAEGPRGGGRRAARPRRRQGPDPHLVPERRLVREPGLRGPGRRPHLLRHDGGPPDRAAGRAPGRDGAEPGPGRPGAPPRGRGGPAQRGDRSDGAAGRHHPRAGRRGRRGAPRCRSGAARPHGGLPRRGRRRVLLFVRARRPRPQRASAPTSCAAAATPCARR